MYVGYVAKTWVFQETAWYLRFSTVSCLTLTLSAECLYDRVSQETADSAEITQRLSKVNKYICEKIMDINKSIKNEERRESKLLIRQTVKMENFNYDGM